jgi:putative Mg2+ transporter-C (MgtC) family protein
METFVLQESLQSVGIAVLCGSLIGFEREFRNKAAGFRTVVLICVGSAVFTILSRIGYGSDDRIAANIITGIGFIGAGVIFKGKVSVQGLTTAAVIWTTAGIGMSAGKGFYAFSLALTLITLMVLIILSRIEQILSFVQLTTLFITFKNTSPDQIEEVESLMEKYHLRIKKRIIHKKDQKMTLTFDLRGDRKHILSFSKELLQKESVMEFSYT